MAGKESSLKESYFRLNQIVFAREKKRVHCSREPRRSDIDVKIVIVFVVIVSFDNKDGSFN